MAQTKFLDYFKGFNVVANTFYKTLIDGKKDAQPYYHKALFTEEYSVDGKWRSVTGDSSRVTADLVTLDSRLPLKKRDSIKKAEDSIPKLGMKMTLNENQMKQIQLLELTNNFAQVENILYRDAFRVVQGIEEMKEYMALQAVSTGMALVADSDKPGIGVRVDFGVPANNRFGVDSVAWSNPASDPIKDIDRMVDYAFEEGYSLRYIHMDKKTSRLLLANANVKAYYGNSIQVTGTNFLAPRLEQLNDALSSDKGYVINVIDRTVKFERDGVREVKNCWADGMVVGTVDLSLGKVVHTDLAEERFPDEDVVYTKVGSHILMSRWHENDPIREFTSSQASVIPVLDDVDSIFYLDTNDEVSANDSQTEGDANITVKSNTVTREAFIAALNKVGVTKANDRNTDAKLLEYYNSLTDENEALVDTELGI